MKSVKNTKQAGTQIIEVALNKLLPDSGNARTEIDETSDMELAKSIKDNGVLQPIGVRKSDHMEFDYKVIYGHRRLRASKIAKLKTIPCIVYDVTDEEATDIQAFENLHRKDLSPLDEAKLFKQLLSDQSIEWLASKIHKSKKYINDRLSLNNLVGSVQEYLANGELPLGHAIMIAKLDEAYQSEIIEKIMDTEYGSDNEKYFVDCTLNELKKKIEDDFTLELVEAPFDLNESKLVPEAGACSTCPKRTCNQKLLFDDLSEEDLCTDRKCYASKLEAHVEMSTEIAKQQFGKVYLGHKDVMSGSGTVKVQGKEHRILEKPTKNSVPVVISKASRWNNEQLGKVVHVELQPKAEKNATAIKTESYSERNDRLFKENFTPNANELVKICLDADIDDVSKLALKVVGNLLENNFERELIVIAKAFGVTPYTEIENPTEYVEEIADGGIFKNELIDRLIEAIPSVAILLLATSITTISDYESRDEDDGSDYYPISFNSLLENLVKKSKSKKVK